jgi:DNA-binding NtrC family response regulator
VWRLLSTRCGEARPEHLSRRIRDATRRRRTAPAGLRSLSEIEREVVGRAIEEALDASSGNVALAARLLGVPRTTLYRRMERFRIRARGGGAGPAGGLPSAGEAALEPGILAPEGPGG